MGPRGAGIREEAKAPIRKQLVKKEKERKEKKQPGVMEFKIFAPKINVYVYY